MSGTEGGWATHQNDRKYHAENIPWRTKTGRERGRTTMSIAIVKGVSSHEERFPAEKRSSAWQSTGIGVEAKCREFFKSMQGAGAALGLEAGGLVVTR